VADEPSAWEIDIPSGMLTLLLTPARVAAFRAKGTCFTSSDADPQIGSVRTLVMAKSEVEVEDEPPYDGLGLRVRL